MQAQKKIASNNTSVIFKKIIEDKKAISAFIRGEKSIKDLHERGIKFANPI
jgi:hypothetical protein